MENQYDPNNPLLNQDPNGPTSAQINESLKRSACFIVFFQLPFTICNLYFAIASPHSSCFDQPHAGLVLRSWLLGIGITEIVLMAGIVIPLMFFQCSCMSVYGLSNIWSCVQGITAIKQLVWFIMIFVLFFKLVKFFCTGAIYTYFIILMVLNCLPFVICCLCCCFGGGIAAFAMAKT